MRIVAGAFRGRRLTVPQGAKVRPTAERTRAALFDILIHRHGIRFNDTLAIGDIFAGTGAFGLEALSRGAGHAVFLDHDRRCIAAIQQTLKAVGADHRATMLTANALFPPPSPRPLDLVFLDPPYREDKLNGAIAALIKQRWLLPGALLITEQPAADSANGPVTAPEKLEQIDARRYGRTSVTLMRYTNI